MLTFNYLGWENCLMAWIIWRFVNRECGCAMNGLSLYAGYRGEISVNEMKLATDVCHICPRKRLPPLNKTGHQVDVKKNAAGRFIHVRSGGRRVINICLMSQLNEYGNLSISLLPRRVCFSKRHLLKTRGKVTSLRVNQIARITSNFKMDVIKIKTA